MTFDLANGRRLLLSGDGRAWLWLVAGIVALALVALLYRYERRLVSRKTGLTLLGLRLAAALALVFALFNPISEVSYREQVRGRVLVGVDLSESMATADPNRPADSKERLRKSLDLSPSEIVESLPRREIARRLLQGPWMKAIASAHDVEAIGFARDAVPGTPETLAKALGRPPRPDDPAGQVTDWDPVLGRALQEKDAAPVVGVVLLTDGRRNAPGDPGPLTDKLAARGVPVYPVLIGSTVAPRDAAIAAIKSPESVYKGDVAHVEATLKIDGPAGAEVPVTLDRPGASPLRKTVRVPGDGSRPVVSFAVPLEAVGPQPLTVAVGPIDGDVRPDNDRRTVTVQVADDKARVLLVDGEARWEFQYLRNALARDPRVSVESIIFRQPTSASAADATYKMSLPAKPDPVSGQPDPLGAFDAIIVGDVDPSDLTPEGWARLDSYVASRGGTLVLGPGPRSFEAMLGHEALRKLLPVLDPRPVSFDATAADPAHPALPAGVTIAPTASATAESWPMLQFAAEADRSRAIWLALPKLPWVVAGRAKPAATVLASASTSGGTKEEDAAVIAAMPYGLGKVLWVGTDGTWRWRHRVGDAYHHRFWGQAVRWAASGKLAAGNRLVRFGPERPRIADGDGVALRARFSDDAPNIAPDLLVAARVFKAAPREPAPPSTINPPSSAIGDAVAVVPLRPKAGQPRAFEGTAPALPPGPYVIRLDVPQLSGAFQAESASPPEAPLEITPRDTPERVELSASRDPLDRLASSTGGLVFADDSADGLPKLLRSHVQTKTRTEETALWDRPAALILFFAILTIEWVLRKRAGLP